MRVIIANNGNNITYENVSNVDDRGDELILVSNALNDNDYVKIHLNGWLIAKAASCRIEKRCLTCVDEVFLDTIVEGV